MKESNKKRKIVSNLKSNNKKRFLEKILKKYENIFELKNEILLCKLCSTLVSYETKFRFNQHLSTKQHKDNIDKIKDIPKQQMISFISQKDNMEQTDFNKNLCLALIVSNIPLNKLSNVFLKDFLEKYTKYKIPDQSTLRKNYLLKNL